MNRAGAMELLRAHPPSFVILATIALRAKRTNSGISDDGLVIGEALLGDYLGLGVTRQQARTSQQKLEKWHLATFRGTNKGTIATLTSTTVFDINAEADNQQANQQPTNRQPTNNQQTTTKEEGRMKEDKKGKNLPGAVGPLPPEFLSAVETAKTNGDYYVLDLADEERSYLASLAEKGRKPSARGWNQWLRFALERLSDDERARRKAEFDAVVSAECAKARERLRS